MSLLHESGELAAQLVYLAKQARGEADRQSGELRRDLKRASAQLLRMHRAAYDFDRHAEVRALIDGAIDYLVGVITTRTERELAEGVAP